MHRIFTLLTLFSSLFFIACQQQIPVSEKVYVEEIPTKNPGWMKQWQEMKQNESGIIPFGLHLLWSKQDERLLMKNQGSNLFRIRERGPSNIGGRTRAMMVDPRDDNHVFAGGVSGGLWESTDNGASWKPVNEGAANLSVTCITYSPFNPDIIYYGTGEATGNSAGISGTGVYKSTDGGKTWELLEASVIPALATIWDIKHSLTDSNTIYVGTHNNSLYRSKDAGTSFQRIFTASRSIQSIEVFNDSTIIFGAARDGIYSMKESDLSFTNLSLGMGVTFSGVNRIALTSCKAYPDVLFSLLTNSNGTALQGIYKSSNRGKSWQKMSDPSTIIDYSQAWYDLLLAVHPSDSNFVYSGGIKTGFSTDGGKTWRAAGYGHVDIHSLIWKANGTRFWVGSDGGIHESPKSNPAGTVVSKNNGYNVTQFYAGHFFPQSEHTLGGTQDNNTLYGVNGGNTSSSILGGDGAYCFVSGQDEKLLYASWQNANLNVYKNGPFGARTKIDGFKSSNETVWFINPYVINPADGNQLYHPTQRGIWRSTNAGSNWTKITASNIPGTFYSVSSSNEVNPTVYFGGQSSLVYRIDGARDAAAGTERGFITKSPPDAKGGFVGCIEINPLNKNTVVVGFTNISDNSRIWKIVNTDTEDYSWIDISGNLPKGLPVNWIEMDPADTNFIIAATDFGLYTTKDGGANWLKESAIPDVSIHQIQLRERDGKLYIYTHGRGIWTASLYDPALSVQSGNKVSPRISVFPNPAKDRISLNGITDKIIKFEVLNMNGQVILADSRDSIDVSALPPGIYLLRAESASETIVLKWLKS